MNAVMTIKAIHSGKKYLFDFTNTEYPRKGSNMNNKELIMRIKTCICVK